MDDEDVLFDAKDVANSQSEEEEEEEEESEGATKKTVEQDAELELDKGFLEDVGEEEERKRKLKSLEQDFVHGFVDKMAPMVLACDKQALAVAASQDALLQRVWALQRDLEAFANQEKEIVPSLAEAASKLRETRLRISRVNATLSAAQTRLSNISMELHSHLM